MQRIFPWIRKQPAKCKFKLNLRAKGARFSGEYTVEVTWAKVKLFSPGKEGSEAVEEVTYIRGEELNQFFASELFQETMVINPDNIFHKTRLLRNQLVNSLFKSPFSHKFKHLGLRAAAQYDAPILPASLTIDVLSAPCPYQGGKKVHETHFLFCRPSYIKGKELHCKTFLSDWNLTHILKIIPKLHLPFKARLYIC